MHEFIEIMKPVIRILVVEVAATGPHLVDRAGVVVQVERSGDEAVDPVVDVVVVPPGVVLHLLAPIIEVDRSRCGTRSERGAFVSWVGRCLVNDNGRFPHRTARW
eukprot:COSAG01_NODE_6207_length_3795_cov_57.087392_4_plen_105_part_00